MCGILSISLFGKQGKRERKKRVAIARALFVETLRESQPRGKDATGILSVFEDDWYVLKQPIPSAEFVIGEHQDSNGEGDCKKASLADMLNVWSAKPDKFTNALGHVRAGTHGSEYDYENNHPIVITRDGIDKCIAGIHNGVINNDDILFKKYKFPRIGKVDSEVIFQLLYEFSEDGIIGKKTLEETYDALSGSFAFLGVSMHEPEVMAGAVNTGRPCDVYFIPEIQAAVFVSDDRYLKEAMKTYKRAKIRKEFDRDLTLEEYKKSLARKLFKVDTREDVKSVDDIFIMVEDAPKSFATGNCYENEVWVKPNTSIGTTTIPKTTITPKEKETALVVAKKVKEQNEAYTEAPYDLDGYGQAAGCHGTHLVADTIYGPPPTEEETEENFSPPPAPAVANDKDDSENEELEYAEVEVIEEAEETDGYDEFAFDLSYDDLKRTGEDIIERLVLGDSAEFYEDVRDKLSVFSGDGEYDELMSVVAQRRDLYPLIENTYREAFGEGFAVGFRDGTVYESDFSSVGNGMTTSQSMSLMEDEIEALRTYNDKLQRVSGKQKEALRRVSSLATALLPKTSKDKLDIPKTKEIVGKQLQQTSLIRVIKLVKEIENTKRKEKAKLKKVNK